MKPKITYFFIWPRLLSLNLIDIHFRVWLPSFYNTVKGIPYCYASFWVETFFLPLSVPPIMVVSLDESAVVEKRHTVNLTCLATGDPPPAYTWTKDGLPVDSSVHLENGNRSLVLRDVRSAGSGLYTCVAWNEAGNVSTSTNLSVHGKSGSCRICILHWVVGRTCLVMPIREPSSYWRAVTGLGSSNLESP